MHIVTRPLRIHPPTGPEFEKRILANERNNAKFNFLVPTDPYHAYYQMRVGGKEWECNLAILC
jgi:splicing factor 3A subunit 1